MKRLLFILSLAFLACASYAQSQVLQLPDFKGKKAVWIVRGGLGLNGVAGSYKETQQKVWEHSDYDGSFKFNPSYPKFHTYQPTLIAISGNPRKRG